MKGLSRNKQYNYQVPEINQWIVSCEVISDKPTLEYKNDYKDWVIVEVMPLIDHFLVYKKKIFYLMYSIDRSGYKRAFYSDRLKYLQKHNVVLVTGSFSWYKMPNEASLSPVIFVHSIKPLLTPENKEKVQEVIEW